MASFLVFYDIATVMWQALIAALSITGGMEVKCGQCGGIADGLGARLFAIIEIFDTLLTLQMPVLSEMGTSTGFETA